MDLSTSQLARHINYRARVACARYPVCPRANLPGRTMRGLGACLCLSEAVRRVPCFLFYGWFFEHLPGPYQDGIGREVSTVCTGK